MKHHIVLFLLITLSTSGLVSAQSLCQRLNAAIDSAVMGYATTLAQGEVSDRSAPQQTARLIQAGHKLQQIDINLTLMSQNKCPPRNEPINPDMYGLSAMKCISEMLKARGGKTTNLSECQFKNWKPDLEHVGN